jgi:hypothetical protein
MFNSTERMAHMEKPTFYVEPPQKLIDWVTSPEGQEAIRDAEEAAEQVLRGLDEERTLTREMLQQPITL